MLRGLLSILNEVGSHKTRSVAFVFNLSRFLLPLLTDACDACQRAQRAREGSQGSVASLSDARCVYVTEEGVRGVEGRGAGAFCAWWQGWPTARGARGPDSAVAYNS